MTVGQHLKIIWTLRACARRERHFDVGERRLTEKGLATWRAFSGRLHEGDYVSLVIENNAAINPLALRPLDERLTGEEGSAILEEALADDASLLTASTATFLEATALAFGRPALGPERRSAFEPIRAQEQRILEFPSTAARVSAMVAPPGAPLETYVGYVVADNDDEFLIGLAMLEFDRNAAPTLVRVAELEAHDVRGVGTFSRAVTLGGEDALLALLPPGMAARIVTL